MPMTRKITAVDDEYVEFDNILEDMSDDDLVNITKFYAKGVDEDLMFVRLL